MNVDYTLKNEIALNKNFFDDTTILRRYLNSPNSFRDFATGLTELVSKCFYTGPDTPEAKASFLYEKLQAISSTITIEKLMQWFQDEEKRPVVKNDSRQNMYEICFALNLDLDLVRWFFSHVYYDRSFNCHCMDEAVYYFCFKNALSYSTAKSIIHTVKSHEAPVASFFDDSSTNKIITEYLDQLQTEEDLINFLLQNKAFFEEGRWNQSALEKINYLRNEILGGDNTRDIIAAIRKTKNISKQEIDKCGLLIRELYQDYSASPEKWLEDEIGGRQIFSDSFLLAKILGIKTPDGMPKKSKLPVIIKQNFPRKVDFCAILNNGGSSKSYNSIRKTLILLHFYFFWCNSKLNFSDQMGNYGTDKRSKTFEDEANRMLSECGYEPLTASNPYDWLYLSASRQEAPLEDFRYFISEIIDVPKTQKK